MVVYHLKRYLLGLVSTYLCTYHRLEDFLIALASYVVSWGVRITYRPDIFLLTFCNRLHQLSTECLCLWCIGGHWYATLIKRRFQVFISEIFRVVGLLLGKLTFFSSLNTSTISTSQSAENHTKQCHRFCLRLRHAVILISNVFEHQPQRK